MLLDLLCVGLVQLLEHILAVIQGLVLLPSASRETRTERCARALIEEARRAFPVKTSLGQITLEQEQVLDILDLAIEADGTATRSLPLHDLRAILASQLL